jgi:cell division protease FtsH
MVTEFGMSEKLGSVRYAGERLRFLAGAPGTAGDLSAETMQTIDDEVRRIVGEQLARAESLLLNHRGALVTLATRLLAAESLDGAAVIDALAPDAAAKAGAAT